MIIGARREITYHSGPFPTTERQEKAKYIVTVHFENKSILLKSLMGE